VLGIDVAGLGREPVQRDGLLVVDRGAVADVVHVAEIEPSLGIAGLGALGEGLERGGEIIRLEGGEAAVDQFTGRARAGRQREAEREHKTEAAHPTLPSIRPRLARIGCPRRVDLRRGTRRAPKPR
jgi:hypothetical protein